MGTPTLEALVEASVAAVCGTDPAAIGPDTDLDELGLDSLSLVSAASLIEAARGIELDADATARLLEARSVADLVALFSPR